MDPVRHLPTTWRSAAYLRTSCYYPFGRGADPGKIVTREGGLPYESDGDARRKIRIKPIKETNLGVVQALFDP